MKFGIIVAAVLTACSTARADDACDHSYAALKQFEAENAAWRHADTDDGLRNASESVCSPARYARIKRNDAYMAKLSGLALKFVQTCARSADHRQEVDEYSSPYFRMLPSGIELTCKTLGH